MKRIIPIPSPAYPAALLLYGMIFALAGAHFMAVSWSRQMTITLYTVPLVWTLARRVSIGTYLMLGLAAGMLADEKRGRVAHV